MARAHGYCRNNPQHHGHRIDAVDSYSLPHGMNNATSSPPSARTSPDGAVLDPERRRVRFRRDPVGIVYELRLVEGDASSLVVARLDEVIGVSELLGMLRRTRLGWRPEPALGTSAARKDVLRDIARTWSRLRYLAPAATTAK